jgi:hypothetical protein
VKRFQPIADAYAMLHFAILSKFRLKGFQLSAHDEPTRIHDPAIGSIERCPDGLM